MAVMMVILPSMDSLSLFLLLVPFLLNSFPSSSNASPFPPGSLPTSSGYLPIIPNSNAALFFTFYEAQRPTSSLSSTPLLVWLHGGAGCSSLTANFLGIGPYLLSRDNSTLYRNPDSWNRHFGLLFIDNPLGAGFSAAPSPVTIPRDQPTIARHLFAALQSFLSSNPSFRRRPLFLTGSSYAGKYISAAGYHILRHNPRLPVLQRINLVGVAIGSGLIHPIVQVDIYGAVLYYAGLINDRERTDLESLQRETVSLTVKRKWEEANVAFLRELSWLQNANVLRAPSNDTMLGVFLNKEEVKEALGVKKRVKWESCSQTVSKAMQDDPMQSVKFEMEELVRKIRVFHYQGIEDLLGGVASMEAWIKRMKWEGLERFMAAERKAWMVDGEQAGYVQWWESLSHVMVFGAGHEAAADQKRTTQDMIEDWVLEQGFFGHTTLCREM